jgi:3-mercaptopyruvate sulfurtransferase SseA
VFVNFTRDGIDTNSSVPLQVLPNGGSFAAAMEAKGVTVERPVVVRCNIYCMLAARLWWSLTVPP